MSQMKHSRMPTKSIRLPDLIPPPGAKPVGVFDDGSPGGKIIYELKVLDVPAMKAGKVQKVDYDGAPVFKKHATTGEAMYPIMVLPQPIFRVKRFILVADQTLKVKMVEHFAETPADIAEREDRRKVSAFSEDLAREAISRGYSNASEMLAALLGEKDEEFELSEPLSQAAQEATSLVESGELGGGTEPV